MTKPAFPDMATIQERLVINRDIPNAVSGIVAGTDNPRILISISRSLNANASIVEDIKKKLGDKVVNVVSVVMLNVT